MLNFAIYKQNLQFTNCIPTLYVYLNILPICSIYNFELFDKHNAYLQKHF